MVAVILSKSASPALEKRGEEKHLLKEFYFIILFYLFNFICHYLIVILLYKL